MSHLQKDPPCVTAEIFDSSLFEGSTLGMTKDEIISLQGFFDFTKFSTELLYKATSHGFGG